MHANGDIERGYPPVLPLASRGALVGATPLLVTGPQGETALVRNNEETYGALGRGGL